jgi:bifunctional non-homologous end joining protein LigD
MPPTKRVEVEVEGRRLSLGNLDKALFPDGTTKAEVIHYLTAVAPALLRHLAGRALTVVRFPDGSTGPSFFEKRCPSHAPEWVRTVDQWVTSDSTRWGGTGGSQGMVPFVVVDGLPTLVWLGGMAALELHTPMAQAAGRYGPDVPTMVVLDLDPGPPADATTCAVVALRIREVLDGLGLDAVVKSSGKKGLQVYVPLNHPATTQESAKAFAQAVALLLEARDPKLVVSQQRKDLRPGKVLIDWLQNEAFKTTICAYSLRARDRAACSTPLAWDEVEALAAGGDPESVMASPAELIERLGRLGDLFAPAVDLVQELPRLG